MDLRITRTGLAGAVRRGRLLTWLLPSEEEPALELPSALELPPVPELLRGALREPSRGVLLRALLRALLPRRTAPDLALALSDRAADA